jgi:xylulokinase
MPHAIGIDLGTSGIKVGMLNLATLRLDSLASSELEGGPEVLAADLWQRTKHTLTAALDMLGGKGTVVALGVSGQMHGAVLYDEKGRVIDPIFTWQDAARCSPEILGQVQAATARLGGQDLGAEMACGDTGAILLWIKQNDPPRFRSIARFSLLPDFIRGQLLGRPDHCTDPTHASGVGLFDVRQGRWRQELIAALGLEPRLFPQVRSSAARAGVLARPLAEELGLPEIPVIFGGGDNQVGMLGSGLLSPDSPILINIGTAAQISKVVAQYAYRPGRDTRSFFQGQFALVGASPGGGGSYQLLRTEIQRRQGQPIAYAELDRCAALVAPGAGGLEFSAGPTRQAPGRRRGFYGNTAHLNDPGHQARAVMEGVLLDLYAHYPLLQRHDGNAMLLGAGKGLQASALWPQIAAAIFGKPLRIVASENVVLGAALLAAWGAGYNVALGQGALEHRDVLPDPVEAEAYARHVIGDDRRSRQFNHGADFILDRDDCF